MAAARRVMELELTEEELTDSRVGLALANGTGEPRAAGAHPAGLSPDAFALCDRARDRSDASDRRAMSSARAGPRRQGGARRQAASGTRADDQQRGADVRRRPGLPQAQGLGLSA